ncbi:hypothetical protein MAIC_11510 [Mycolicibacterium aichiense]|uniref:Uncharacterized protein n=1 Tax=Mycolicibacterium aichiense TaxID=1799 RepID=A0AAD1MAF9_9MYCO|nr:hypothetical protein MAIC_11510 [Mycolicibacterium aichiense]
MAHLIHVDIATRGGDADEIRIGACQQVHQCHRVVDAGIDIGENWQGRRLVIPGVHRGHDTCPGINSADRAHRVGE